MAGPHWKVVEEDIFPIFYHNLVHQHLSEWLSLAVLNVISPCHFGSTLLDSFCYVEFIAASNCFSQWNWQLHAFLKQRFYPVCSLYILRPLLQASWSQHDDLSILHLWTFPKDLETMIGTLFLVEILNSFLFCCSDAAGIILFLFFIHFETLVLSRLKLL